MSSWFLSLLALDASLSQRLRLAERPGLLRRLASILAHSGDSWYWLAGLLLLAFVGDDHWSSVAWKLILAILVAAVLVLGIKFTVRRSRPPGEWGAVYRSSDPHSFPSGHAARAAMLAVLFFAFGLPGLGVLVSLWAVLVSLARVAMGVHYLSDVLAGGLLGLLLGWLAGLLFSLLG